VIEILFWRRYRGVGVKAAILWMSDVNDLCGKFILLLRILEESLPSAEYSIPECHCQEEAIISCRKFTFTSLLCMLPPLPNTTQPMLANTTRSSSQIKIRSQSKSKILPLHREGRKKPPG